jgi:predicted permease
MRFLRVVRQRARSLFRGARADAELDREIAFHVEALTRENLATGMEARGAREAARRSVGNLASIEERCRDQRRVTWLADVGKDVRYAGRMLRKSPGFTALAAIALALGAGGSIAVYAIGEALLLRSLPYPAPERLVSIRSAHVRRGPSGIGQDDFRDWQSSNTVFERMMYAELSQVSLTGQGEPERITGLSVGPGFFETLGVAPQLGRWFTPEEQRPRADRVVILSHRLWTRKFGARPEVLGATLAADGFAFQVVGVMSENFRMNEGHVAEYWTPIRHTSHGRQQHQYSCYARLKLGVTIEAAQAQMSEIARRLEHAYPDNAGWSVQVEPMRRAFLGELGPAIQVFGAAAALVLLIACANIASLLLARGVGRAKEIAVRIAMGAGRSRVVRLLLVESLLLSSLGVMAGAALAWWLIRVAIFVAPRWLQLGDIVSVSPTLASFVLALTLAIGVLTGLWPALRGSRAELQKHLKESGASVVSSARPLQSLVVAEIALAVALLACAGLLVKSFAYLLHVNLGYSADRVLTFRLAAPSRYRDDPVVARFCDTLLTKLGALPGVVSVSASDSIPMGGTFTGGDASIEGRPENRDWADAMVRYAVVTPGYLRTIGLPLRRGRGFEATDTADAEPVMIVNEAFSRKLMPDGSPIGVRARQGSGPWRRIVGVVADSRYEGPMKGTPAEAYVPFAQNVYFRFIAVRTAIPETAVLPAIRAALREVEPEMPITQVRTMQEAVTEETALPRSITTLVGGFAIIAVAMSTLGLGGVMTYTVSRRRREIGLRIALGACGADISREVLLSAGRLIAAGAALGTAGALAGTRLLESVLYGVRPDDPAAIAAAPVALAAFALLACLVPARRAASVDPMMALRQE